MAKFIDMEANVTVSMAAEILGKNKTADQVENGTDNKEKQLNK